MESNSAERMLAVSVLIYGWCTGPTTPKRGMQPCITHPMSYKQNLCAEEVPNAVHRFCHQSHPGESSRCTTNAKFHSCAVRAFWGRDQQEQCRL